jgi:5-formyltetrahydrofolate cyclo-ligase
LLPTVPDQPPPGPRSKRATRQTLRARREALGVDERADASARIAAAVNAVLDERLVAGQVLAIYAAKGTEVETVAIAEHAARRGISLAYPRVVDGARALTFHEVPVGELVVAHYGIREPRADVTPIALERIAAFVVPGLAFDRDGGRIGWGRGYYDVTLAQTSGALRIGIAFDCQLVDRVPRDPHDVPMNIIITEVATHVVA